MLALANECNSIVELGTGTAWSAQHRGDAPVELLFIDSSHDADSVLAAFRVWRDALASGAMVVFHDYDHPVYPGVRQAVAELELSGCQSGGLFVWRAP